MAAALIDFPAPDGARERLAFGAPREVLVARTHAEVRGVLDAAERLARAGRWCVGCVRYEAAPAFDPALAVHEADGALAWFGVHDAPLPWPAADAPAPSLDWQATLARVDFDRAVQRIVRAIADGEVYQVNLTAPLRAAFSGAPLGLFDALRRAQPAGYVAYVDAGDERVLSVSPELFFERRGTVLRARPMKGTAPRGATHDDDARHAAALRASEKERAENLMIVDLVRNDLARVAETGSVAVPRLFHVEPLPSVWQMTSDVTARARADATLADVFGALFPCGSVTGAPKVAAMRLIRALEAAPRGVYCGAVGVLRPGGDATFNVPIRTVVVRGAEATCGIGSGITADSTPAGEWAEWRHKRAFLERASRPFELLETLRLHEGTFAHEALHLQRMAHAATHFGFAWHEADVRAALGALAAAHPRGAWRARLTLDARGAARATAAPLDEPALPLRVALAAAPMDAPDEFVRFKTTRRAHYDAFAPRTPGVFDTLLWNDRRELTEFTRGNAAFEIDGRWVTPPLSCGLLPGVGRALALEQGRVVEAVVTLDDLPRVRALAFVNSLRGWLPAVVR